MMELSGCLRSTIAGELQSCYNVEGIRNDIIVIRSEKNSSRRNFDRLRPWRPSGPAMSAMSSGADCAPTQSQNAMQSYAIVRSLD